MKVLFLKLLLILCSICAMNIKNSVVGYVSHGYVSKEEYIRLQKHLKFDSTSSSSSTTNIKYKIDSSENSDSIKPIKIRHPHSRHPHLDNLISKMTTSSSVVTNKKLGSKTIVDKTEEEESTIIEENDLKPSDYDEWGEDLDFGSDSRSRESDYYSNDEDYEEEEQEEERHVDDDWQDEPGESTLSPFTKFKWATFGSRQKVERTRKQFMSDSSSVGEENDKLVVAHVRKILSVGKCLIPYLKIVSVQDVYPDSSKKYMPRCTILHRCAEDTGCCSEDRQICGVKNQEIVELTFLVSYVGMGNQKIEKLRFENHTECGCLDKQRTTNYNRKRNLISDSNRKTWNSGISLRSMMSSDVQNLKKCKCPSEYKPRKHYQTKCHCDCYEDSTGCLRIKKGLEHFSLVDRVCIKNDECGLPACTYGKYREDFGRCPRYNERYSYSNPAKMDF